VSVLYCCYIHTTIMKVAITSVYFFFILVVRELNMERNTSVMLHWNLHSHFSG
jgi:hypothetical protein